VTAASRSQDSRKKTTVLEDIIHTVLSVGDLCRVVKVTCNNKLLSLFYPLP
jgi:hypothetical protein